MVILSDELKPVLSYINSAVSVEERAPVLVNIKKSEESRGFRIKKVVTIAFYFLLAAFSVMAAAGSFFLVGMGSLSVISAKICSLVVLVSLIGLGVLLTLKVWQWIEPYAPNVVRLPLNYIQSFICGGISAVVLAIIWPINLEKKNPTARDCDKNQTPILMIHGFLGSSNNWIYHRYRLKNAGYKNLFSINLGSHFTSLTASAEKLRKMVKEVYKQTGRNDIVFLCHSRGGLVAREYNQHYASKDGVEVKKIITLGTPLRGTGIAKCTFGFVRSCKEMYPDSDIVKEQQKFVDCSSKTQYLHIASRSDHIICPTTNALPSIYNKNIRIKWLNSTGHISYLFSDAAADLIIQNLSQH